MLRWLGWLLEVADVPGILIEGAVDSESTAVQEDHEHEPAEQERFQGKVKPNGQECAEKEVGRHDGPFQGAEMQDIGHHLWAEESFETLAQTEGRGLRGIT
jgi:hypothetical protein